MLLRRIGTSINIAHTKMGREYHVFGVESLWRTRPILAYPVPRDLANHEPLCVKCASMQGNDHFISFTIMIRPQFVSPIVISDYIVCITAPRYYCIFYTSSTDFKTKNFDSSMTTVRRSTSRGRRSRMFLNMVSKASCLRAPQASPAGIPKSCRPSLSATMTDTSNDPSEMTIANR